LGLFALGISLMAIFSPRHANAQHPASVKTTMKEVPTGPTADQQYMNPSDRAITQRIRKAIHHDRSLSIHGRNIKIYIQDGKVILRGPVQSQEEKGNLEAKAISVAGQENVSNQLEIAPSK
jgi:osmotically-inducible protein OsmY